MHRQLYSSGYICLNCNSTVYKLQASVLTESLCSRNESVNLFIFCTWALVSYFLFFFSFIFFRLETKLNETKLKLGGVGIERSKRERADTYLGFRLSGSLFRTMQIRLTCSFHLLRAQI